MPAAARTHVTVAVHACFACTCMSLVMSSTDRSSRATSSVFCRSAACTLSISSVCAAIATSAASAASRSSDSCQHNING